MDTVKTDTLVQPLRSAAALDFVVAPPLVPKKNEFDGALSAIDSGSARVGIVGLGYVGLPLAVAVSRAGFRVIGFDVDKGKLLNLQAGRSYIENIENKTIASMIAEHSFKATSDLEHLRAADVILICVPTPLTRNRDPDLSFVISSARAIASVLRHGQLIVLESTTYPGTTRDVVRPILEGSGLKCGADFFLGYSPEREDPGNRSYTTAQIPKVVAGDGPLAQRLACAFYSRIVSQVVPVTTVETAEAVKLTENIYRAVNVALVNELKSVYTAMGINIWEVIEAAKTKPFGFAAFYPGPGLGGHCLPIDPFYLSWKAKEYGISARFIELAGEVNTAMPIKVVNSIATAIDNEYGRGLKGSRILVLGVAYKRDVNDTRESPALTIMELLEQRGALVDYHDPHVAVIGGLRQHSQFKDKRSMALSASELEKYDVVVVCTDHSQIDFGFVVQYARLIVDTRNACQGYESGTGKIVAA
jgi:UDP-N-acetyl-D-glucosamine dehydrogenase